MRFGRWRLPVPPATRPGTVATDSYSGFSSFCTNHTAKGLIMDFKARRDRCDQLVWPRAQPRPQNPTPQSPHQACILWLNQSMFITKQPFLWEFSGAVQDSTSEGNFPHLFPYVSFQAIQVTALRRGSISENGVLHLNLSRATGGQSLR